MSKNAIANYIMLDSIKLQQTITINGEFSGFTT